MSRLSDVSDMIFIARLSQQQERHDAHVKRLYRVNKRQLAAIIRQHSDLIWSAAPPEKWSKDELVNEVLRFDPAPPGIGDPNPGVST